MEKINKIGRPILNIDRNIIKLEIEKYLNKEQSGVTTYRNLGIGKTSFYRILKKYKENKEMK